MTVVPESMFLKLLGTTGLYIKNYYISWIPLTVEREAKVFPRYPGTLRNWLVNLDEVESYRTDTKHMFIQPIPFVMPRLFSIPVAAEDITTVNMRVAPETYEFLQKYLPKANKVLVYSKRRSLYVSAEIDLLLVEKKGTLVMSLKSRAVFDACGEPITMGAVPNTVSFEKEKGER